MTLILVKALWYILIVFLSHAQAEDPKKEASPVLQDLSASETCPNVMCTKPPSELPCNKTEVTNPNVISKLGTLKSCCFAFKCFEKDGSISTYFGITGEEVTNDISSNSTTPKDKCSLITCPKPIEEDATCSVSNAADANDFKPKGELQNCCPLYNCTVTADGTYHTRYVLSAGNIPKDEAVIAKEKGTPTADKKCASVKCASKPVAYGCEATFQNFSSTLKTLGPFQECCPLWKCCFDDGTYFTHYEITTPSSWMAETSYFSSNKKPVDGAQTTKAPPEDKDGGGSAPQGRGLRVPPAPEKPAPAPGLGRSAPMIEPATTTKAPNAPKQSQSLTIKQGPPKEDDESGEEGDEDEGEDSTGKTISLSQQQGGGGGNSQQQQLVIIQQASPKKSKPKTTTTTTEKPKGLLNLNLGALNLG